uniref:Intracellular proteinase inhibitor BsuPI domain-containing protein n=1 Tax=Caldiarchaeum subterraneum TaxID=311458 RepID=E6NAJ1_CALS0|nr:hypothetical protein HGMM_F01D06C14 [Candidatus Caldarchaeum subterraneum]
MRTAHAALFIIGAVIVFTAAAWAAALQIQTTSPTSPTQQSIPPHDTQEKDTEAPPNPSQPPITLTLQISPQTAGPTASINAVLTLTNTGTTAVNIEYFIGQLFEIIIKNTEGVTVYRLSATTPYRYMMSRPLQLTLNPGETYQQNISLKLVDTAGQPLPPGTYTATAYLTAAVEHHPPPEGKAAAKSNTVQIIITQ